MVARYWLVVCSTFAMACTLSAQPAGLPAVDPEKAARADAIRSTLANIEAQAKAQGGWDGWYAKLKPFREDLAAITKGKWPWPSKNNFVFYGQSARLLMMEDWNRHPGKSDPFTAIVSLNRQLKDRGIDLIFMPIPDKLAVYPDYLSQKTPEDRMVYVQSKQMLAKLCDADVEVIDLFDVYNAYRREKGDGQPLFLTRDGHWRNLGAQIAGDQIARRLSRYAFVKKAIEAGNPYEPKPGSRDDGVKADANLRRVALKSGGFYNDVPDSPVVLTGDSFSMYNMGEKAAHLSAQVALGIGMPLTYVCREGLAVDMPIELARRQGDGKFLTGRRVIVWTVRGRCLGEGGWCAVNLSEPAAPELMLRGMPVSATVAEVSAGPRADAPYVNYVMELAVKDVKDAAGKPVGDGTALLRVLAMRDRKILPTAQTKAGDVLNVRLTAWSAVESQYGRINTGVLTVVGKARYWAEAGDAATQPAPGASQ